VEKVAHGNGEPYLIKVSGESFAADAQGISESALEFTGQEILKAWEVQPNFAVVVGGGNFYRGRGAMPGLIDQLHADHVGMLATIMNGIILQQWFTARLQPAVALSAFPVGHICETYSAVKARSLIERGILVVMAGGTGSPFFTTDTTACLRALEIGAKTVIKATNVNGIYDRDPFTDRSATMFQDLDYQTALNNHLTVMDATAFALCRDNRLTIHVLNLGVPGNLCRAVQGYSVGTLVSNGRSKE